MNKLNISKINVSKFNYRQTKNFMHKEKNHIKVKMSLWEKIVTKLAPFVCI